LSAIKFLVITSKKFNPGNNDLLKFFKAQLGTRVTWVMSGKPDNNLTDLVFRIKSADEKQEEDDEDDN